MRNVDALFDFLQKRMENGQGGYFSAIDADNKDGEGRYYVFDIEEIEKVAGNYLDLFLEYYQVNLDEPIENSYYHLRMSDDIISLLKKFGINEANFFEKKSTWENQFEIIKVGVSICSSSMGVDQME